MKTVNLNSVTLKKNGTPVELMGVRDEDQEFRLIDTITLSENVTSFNYTINCDEVIIKMVSNFSNNKSIALVHSPTDLSYFGKEQIVRGSVPSGERNTLYAILKNHGFYYGYYISNTGNYENGMSPNFSYVFKKLGKITNVNLACYGDTISAGTVLEIYAH